MRVLLFFLFLSGPALAQEIPRGSATQLGLSQKKLDRIVPAMRKLIEQKKIPGIVTLVAKRGKIVHFEALGWNKVGGGRLRKDSIFRLASMTKPITAVALMILWEEKKFSLSDPVSKHLSDLKDLKVRVKGKDVPATHEMTIAELLTHTGGLAYGYSLGKTEVDRLYTKAKIMRPGSTLKEMVTKLGELPLAYQPGEKWAYSLSCDVQARLVEVLAEESFDVFLQKRIFLPLDMRDTGYLVPAKKLKRLMWPHFGSKLKPLGKQEHALLAPKFKAGGHGLFSTARDYLRFAEMMRRGGKLGSVRLLRSETIALMMKNQIPEKLIPIDVNGNVLLGHGFGFGGAVQVKKTFRNQGTVGRYGWAGAMSTTFFILPRDELVAIALTQVSPYANPVMTEFESLVLASRRSQKTVDSKTKR